MRMTVNALVSVGLAVALGLVAQGQTESANTPEAHIAAAKAAARQDHFGLFDRACGSLTPAAQAEGRGGPEAQTTLARGNWHAEPVKVFDNLYFVGQTEYSAWAVTTSAGIILIDTIYDYSVEDEVVGGLRKLGLDPASIKYAIVSHGHGDHSGGAKYLQDHFGTRIILSADDWNLLDRSNGTKPRRDMVATDGQKLTLGDTTITMYITPGHTYGTISTLIPVKDRGVPHLAAEWGGTLFNWLRNRSAYITPERPDSFWFTTYQTSARRFREIAEQAGADVVLSNHTIYDGSKTKLPAVLARNAGDPNPYVIGVEGVRRYMTVVYECAMAGLGQSLAKERVAAAPAAQPAQAQGQQGGFSFANLPPPMVKENATRKIGPHSYVIDDGNVVLVPNVGIVVGSKATLVVDTGMGPKNGAIVMKEVAKVSKNSQLYLVTTHFHAEHVAGISAFPAGTKYVISRVQQQDLDELGADLTKRFAGGSPIMADLLKNAPVRRADVLFDREYKIDLGGVNVRLLALGSTHTRGDTMVFVEQDKVLYAGDVVMPRVPVAFGQTSSAKAWEDVLAQLTPLGATVIVPAHGPTGTGTMLAEQRAAFASLRSRVRELKAQGQPVDDAVRTLTAEFQQQHPDWTATNRVGAIVRGMYGE
jgi:glyoxylase-like metal-dependent hydrolase (beta-lactamase superfamily II)